MEILLIDVGALAIFLGYMAIVYWHGITREPQPDTRRSGQRDTVRPMNATGERTDVASLDDRTMPDSALARRARITRVATAQPQGPLAPPSRSANAHRN